MPTQSEASSDVCVLSRARRPAFWRRPSPVPQEHSNTIYTDLNYDKEWFPAEEERHIAERDPDLIIFAYARLAFCCNLHAQGRELPAPCHISLGAKVEGTAAEQRAWALHLLFREFGNSSVLHYEQLAPVESIVASLMGHDLCPFIEKRKC